MKEPMPDCLTLAEDLTLHAAGEPAPHVETHLSTCSACRQRHAELRGLCRALHELRDFTPSEPVVRFDFRRAFWPIAIAASVLVALWPAAPAPKPSAVPEPPTWLAYQRAAAHGDAALDALLESHADVFQQPVSTDQINLLTAFALQP